MRRIALIVILICLAQSARAATAIASISVLDENGNLIGNLNGATLYVGTTYIAQAVPSSTSGTIAKVNWYWNDKLSETDTAAPFQRKWTVSSAGKPTIKAVPYDSKGTAGTSLTVTCQNVTGSPTPTATPTITPTATPNPTPTVTPSPSTTPTPSPSGAGIASRYPNDKNIGSDPDVLLADDFEGYAAGITGAAWNTAAIAHGWFSANVGNKYQSIDGAEHFGGAKSLNMTLPVATAEQSAEIKENPTPQQDTVFIRVYEKWKADYHSLVSNHNGAHIKGGTITAGQPVNPDGTSGFTFTLQQNHQNIAGEQDPGYDMVYAYWPKMCSAYGDHWFPNGKVVPCGTGEWIKNPAQYPDFKVMPLHQPKLNQWYCYELMVRLNTVGKNNGEVKWWCDGVVIADFPNLVIRGVDTLKADQVGLRLHATQAPTALTKWYDNVVIAKSYIGPMSTGGGPTPSPTVTPTATPIPSPTPTATPTGTPTPSATPPTPTPTPTATPSVSPSPTPTPTASPPQPTPTPSPTPSPSPTGTPTLTPTPSPSPTPTPPSGLVQVTFVQPQPNGTDIYTLYGVTFDGGTKGEWTVMLKPNTTYKLSSTAKNSSGESIKGDELIYTTTAAPNQRVNLGEHLPLELNKP